MEENSASKPACLRLQYNVLKGVRSPCDLANMVGYSQVPVSMSGDQSPTMSHKHR